MDIQYQGRHPLLRIIRPPFFTPPIEKLGNFIINAYQSGRHGCRVISFTRYGKTYAITYLKDNAGWRTDPAVFLDMRILAPEKCTERSFFTTMSLALHLRELHQSSSAHAVMRVAHHLNILAEEEGAELIIFALDESQRLNGDDWQHVVTLDNEVSALGKRLFLIFIHQLDTKGKEAESIHDDVPPQVLERFTKPCFDFPGIIGALEVKTCFEEYDAGATWPLGSGTTYSAYFAPDAFARGWRLSQHAQQVYDIATELRAESGLYTEGWQWPMVSLEALMRYLLVSVPSRTPGFDGFTDEDIRKALIAAFFVD